MTTLVDERDAMSPRVGDDTVVDWDARHWTLAADAHEALSLRHVFRAYLVAHGHPASDFHAAEVVYGELVANCARYAPGRVRVEFRWHDATLAVVDGVDRLRSWPFSSGDDAAETPYHAYALMSGLGRRVHLAREPGGGTRASVVLPVLGRD
jgi:hypothetical protein